MVVSFIVVVCVVAVHACSELVKLFKTMDIFPPFYLRIVHFLCFFPPFSETYEMGYKVLS